MPDLNGILAAIGILIGIVVPSAIAFRVARSAAKKSDIETLQSGYRELMQTNLTENARLSNDLQAERNARRADKLECQTQIDALQRQLTVLLTKMPEPGSLQQVIIAGIDTDALPALPVKLTDVQDGVILPTELKRPIPLLVTAAEQRAAAIEAGKKE